MSAVFFLYFMFVNGSLVAHLINVDKNINALLPNSTPEQKMIITEIFLTEAEISAYEDDVKKILKIRAEEKEKENLENEIISLRGKKESMEAVLSPRP